MTKFTRFMFVPSKESSHSYHIEAQMEKDKDIVVRVFEYCFLHALETQEDDNPDSLSATEIKGNH